MAASVTLCTRSQIGERDQAAESFNVASNLAACENAEHDNHKLLLQSPQNWPIPTRTTVLNRCTAAIYSAGYELSANQQLCGLQVVLVAIGQN